MPCKKYKSGEQTDDICFTANAKLYSFESNEQMLSNLFTITETNYTINLRPAELKASSRGRRISTAVRNPISCRNESSIFDLQKSDISLPWKCSTVIFFLRSSVLTCVKVNLVSSLRRILCKDGFVEGIRSEFRFTSLGTVVGHRLAHCF